VITDKEVKLLKQVNFAHDSAEILDDSKALLSEIAGIMKENMAIRRVEVQGHTDNTGSGRYNLMLSQQRAEAVVEGLIRLGVDAARMTARGYGAERPLAPNVSDANRAKNRRVQIVILERN
jgi:outer membrane protein OmpA-like peptidoglycan-associated protein